MLELNRAACEEMLRFEPHGCTDVTGFGLIGHAREMALASGVTLEIDAASVASCPARWICGAGAVPGGLKNNREFASCAVESAAEIPREVEDLLYDPQTSGGLLIAAAAEFDFPGAYRMGRVLPRGDKPIRLI